jgi:FkbM family methyltransferase
MFAITSILPDPPRIKIVDVGAMSLGDEKDPYARLMKAVSCEVIGFEPVAAECESLNRKARPGCMYLPYAVGDGSGQIFHQCNFPMTSSLLEPNDELLAMFHDLRDVTRVVEKRRVQTVRLDDLAEVRGVDYLKLDVQGGELMVLQGAIATLRDVLVLHTEIEFLPMYRRQPLFADIDAFLRGHGFVLHNILGMKGATFKLPGIDVELSGTVNQTIWGEVVYVRDFMNLEELSAAALLKLAVILHENYGSCDLAGVVLGAYDRKAGTSLTDHYIQCLFESTEQPGAPAAND